MDAITLATYLQTQLNRYTPVTGRAPIVVDGDIGKNTAFATKNTLAKIVSLSGQYKDSGSSEWADYYTYAWNYLSTVDERNYKTVRDQAYGLADLFQKFGNFYGSPILKDVPTPKPKPTGSSGSTPRPGSTSTSTPTPGADSPSQASTSSRIPFYVGGALILGAIGLLIMQRRKSGKAASPATAVVQGIGRLLRL